MHDGIQFERRGVPAVVFVTEPFVGAARAMAALDGLSQFPFLTLPHPTAELHADEVRRAAQLLADQVAATLLDGAPAASAADPS